MKESKYWVRIAVFNLCIVAGLGALMRYKIGFEFPHFNQKYLQEAHSHFAFTGWITHSLLFLIVAVLRANLPAIQEKVYSRLIVANLVAAYGMLVAFAIQGYGPVSLFFSTLSILVGYVFAFFALRDLGKFSSGHPGKRWIQAAIWLGILSTIGTMVLSQMMATKNYDQDVYLGSIYFYLHFQYNGWFLLACIGLFMDIFKTGSLHQDVGKKAFWLLFLSCIPAYFLSTLWANIPTWLYSIVIIAAIGQLVGWWYLIRYIRAQWPTIQSSFRKTVLLLFLIVASAISLKFLLQLGSTIPSISKLAFGFRPIVIAYLHLVLLVITTLFLIAYMIGKGLIPYLKISRIAVIVFATAAIATEFVLMIQGITGFQYAVVPLVKEMLFGLALVLFGSSLLLVFCVFRPGAGDLNQ